MILTVGVEVMRLREPFGLLLRAKKTRASLPPLLQRDFGRYGREGVPICMFRLGTIEPKRLARMKQLGQEPPSLHSPLFYPDPEEALITGLTATVAATLELLKK